MVMKLIIIGCAAALTAGAAGYLLLRIKEGYKLGKELADCEMFDLCGDEQT